MLRHQKLELIRLHLNRRIRPGQMFLRKALMICKPFYLTRSAPARLVARAITVALPLIWASMNIRSVVQSRLAAALLVVNGRRNPESAVATDFSTI